MTGSVEVVASILLIRNVTAPCARVNERGGGKNGGAHRNAATRGLWPAAVFADDFGDFLFAGGREDRDQVFEFLVEIDFQLPLLEGFGQLRGGEAGFFCPERRWFFGVVEALIKGVDVLIEG